MALLETLDKVVRRQLDDVSAGSCIAVRFVDVDNSSSKSSEAKACASGAEGMVSRALSLMADLLNDESEAVRARSLRRMQQLARSPKLELGDDFVPLIESWLMAGAGAYHTLQGLQLSKPGALCSCIRAVQLSLVRYPKKRRCAFRTLALLSSRHARLLEAVIGKVVPAHTTLSPDNLRHVALAICVHYGGASLAESLARNVLHFVAECRRTQPELFQMQIEAKVHKFNDINPEALPLAADLRRLFSAETCNLSLLNGVVCGLQRLKVRARPKRHRLLSLWAILGDVLQIIELAECGGWAVIAASSVSLKLVALEHALRMLHTLSVAHKLAQLARLALSSCCCLYALVIKATAHQDCAEVLSQTRVLSSEARAQLTRHCRALLCSEVSVWASLRRMWALDGQVEFSKSFCEYERLLHGLSTRQEQGAVEAVDLREIVELTAEHKMYFHALAPVDIAVQCRVLSEWARCMTPSLQVRVRDVDGKTHALHYRCFSAERWAEELAGADSVLSLNIRIPSVGVSTNVNPIKNYLADVVVQMVAEFKDSVLRRVRGFQAQGAAQHIVVSNALTVCIAIGVS